MRGLEAFRDAILTLAAWMHDRSSHPLGLAIDVGHLGPGNGESKSPPLSASCLCGFRVPVLPSDSVSRAFS